MDSTSATSTTTTASNGGEVCFWCHTCTRLHRTRGGEAAEAVAACPICATPRSASSFEEIIDVVDSRTFLHGCHPATVPPPAAARNCPDPLPLVTIHDDAGLSCPICLDELLEHAAVETPCCKNAYHKDCLEPWLEAGGTCPLCRQWPAPTTAPSSSSSSSPDGLILCDLRRNGDFALGRRVAGRVHMVGVVGRDGELVRHCVVPRRPYRVRRRFGVMQFFRAARRLVKAAAREVRDPMHVRAT